MLKNYKYNINNLDCANCAKKIEKEIAKDKRFNEVIVNFNTLTLTFKTEVNDPFSIIKNIVKKVEPGVIITKIGEEINKDYEIYRLILSIIFIILSFIFTNKTIKEILILGSYALLLYKTLINAFKKLKSKRIDENMLICISAIGAYLLNQHMEGLMVVMLYVIGKILENKAINKSRSEIKDLLDLKIDYATLKDGSKIKAEELKINDVVLVKQGDKVPADGIIIKGNTLIDESSLTGESNLKKVEVNDQVLSGVINKGDIIEVKVKHDYYNSAAYKIFELTIEATNNKAKTETMVSKIAGFYTPIVLLIAILLGIFLPFIFNITYSESLYRALTFLVISCPCAIAISVPLSYFAGIGASSKAKVLIKGSNFLDNLTKCDTIVFDKTGTLTTGSFKIKNINIYNKDYQKEEIYKIIISGEAYSNHPIAHVLLNEINDIKKYKIKDFKEIPGKGITYKIGKKEIKVGSNSFNNTNKVGNIFLSIDNKLIAGINFSDNIKENVKEVIANLEKKKIKPIILTGDNRSFTKIVADKIGISEYECELLPEDKYQKLKELKQNHKVIFVGDGINDAPSLALADVGISMGEIGTNSATEASDIIIMNDNLEGIINVLDIAFKTKKIIIMNLIMALSIKVLILILSMFGLANMIMAVFADTGVTLITILNTLRILKR